MELKKIIFKLKETQYKSKAPEEFESVLKEVRVLILPSRQPCYPTESVYFRFRGSA